MRDGLKEIVDRELSGLRWQPRNRNAVLARTKGEPKMKKRLSAGLILAVVLTLAAVSALAVYALTRSPEAEAIYQARQAGEGCFQLGPFEGAGFSIVKNPQADALARPEERAEKFFQRDIQCFPHFRTTSTHRSVKYRTGRPRSWAFSISTAMPFVILPPNTHTSLHLLCKTSPKKMPRRRCLGSLSSMN